MSCLACGHPKPNRREKLDTSRVYCDRSCQLRYYDSIGLKHKGIDYKDRVGLISKEGKRFTLDYTVAIKSNTLKYLIEDSGVDDFIPLPNIESDVLEIIFVFLTKFNPSELELDTVRQSILNNPFKKEDTMRYLEAFLYLDIPGGYRLDLHILKYAKELLLETIETPKIFWEYCRKVVLSDIVAVMNKQERAKIFKILNLNNKYEHVRQLIFNYVDLEPFEIAAATGNVHLFAVMIMILTSKTFDIGKYDPTKLMNIAVKYDQMDMLRFWVTNRKNLKSGVFLYNATAQYGRIEMVEILSPFSFSKWSDLLWIAATYNQKEYVQFMLEKIPTKIDTTDIDFENPKIREDILQMILDWDPQPKEKPVDYTESVEKAILTNNSQQLRTILDSMQREGIPIDYDKFIEYAQQFEREFIIGLLQQWKAAKRIRINKAISFF